MNLPILPLFSNFTIPSTSAKRVSSLPRPTFFPGFHFVPRWRARIFPPTTCSPPNFLRPNLWADESRPLREEPTPFLCAMNKIFDFRLPIACLDRAIQNSIPLLRNRIYFDSSKRLSVPLRAFVMLSSLLSEHQQFLFPPMLNNCGRNFSRSHHRSSLFSIPGCKQSV